MRRAVILKDKVVENIIVIDDDTPKELYDVEIEDDVFVNIGYEYKRGKFVAPKEETE